MLRTRSPLGDYKEASSFDLHVLSMPPTFILSQDQTLRENLLLTSRRYLSYFGHIARSHSLAFVVFYHFSFGKVLATAAATRI